MTHADNTNIANKLRAAALPDDDIADIGTTGIYRLANDTPDPLADLMRFDLESYVARQPKPRKPNIATLIKRAEESGKAVTSITAPDGTRINFGNPDAAEPANDLDQWMARHARETERR